MQTLDELRQDIDRIDGELVRLLIERAQVAIEIGDLKMKEKSPIQNTDREAKVIERVRDMNDGPMSDESIVAIYRGIILACTRVQERTQLWLPDEA